MPASDLLESIRAADEACLARAARNSPGRQIRWQEKELTALHALPQLP